MLKQRIVSLLIVKENRVVQSLGFNRHLPVGHPAIAVEYMNRWGIDEIVILFIDETSQKNALELVKACVPHCQVPLTVGGGVRTVADIEQYIAVGADKVSINTELHSAPEIIAQASELFGSQAIVASIDALCTDDEGYTVMTDGGRADAQVTPWEFAKKVEELGVGEIFLNSIDRDGAKNGYDCELISHVMNAISIPLVVCGGVGLPEHFVEGLSCTVSGVAAANYFHFTEHSVILAKRYIQSHLQNVRLDTYATYEGARFDSHQRLDRYAESYLTGLKFQKIPEEII